MEYNFIAIEGNIGAGKTTLSKMLSDDWNAKLILEQFEDNSFLPKFYKEPDRYAFPVEMSFLADRFNQLKKELGIQDIFKPLIIADYIIDKSVIFAKNTLKGDEFKLYARMFNIVQGNLPRPDLLVFLYVDVDRLMENIKKRGRTYEKYITQDYLQKIQNGYLNFLSTSTQIKKVIFDISQIDFVENHNYYHALREYILTIKIDQSIKIKL